MKELYLIETIEIQATAFKVFEVLTNPEISKEWIHTWWLEIDAVQSEWNLKSPVVWKLRGGKIGAEGEVLETQPHTKLVYTFRAQDTTPKQEVIEYTLEERNGKTKLTVKVGNFADSFAHKMCFPGAQEAWKKCLPKIKQLAETR